MMLLQSDLVQIGSGMISLTTLILVLRLTYGAGQLVEKVEANEKRLDHLELIRCPHAACPLRMQFDIKSGLQG
jgi:membrane protein required for beta-lactamase induction